MKLFSFQDADQQYEPAAQDEYVAVDEIMGPIPDVDSYQELQPEPAVEPVAQRPKTIADVIAPWELEPIEVVAEAPVQTQLDQPANSENGQAAGYAMDIAPSY